MNVNYSMTGDKTPERLTDTVKLSTQWKTIGWNQAETEVNRLQVRIAKAAQSKKYNKVKQLQYLLTHSFYAKMLAVRKVTTNKGKKTAGIDGVLWSTPASKMKAILKLTDKGYNAKPLKRVFIDKKGKKEKRPLGIPTMYDRAIQALYALALDPVSEVTADTNSLGFRKGRGCQDAREYIFNTLAQKVSAKWVLEGDIKGCFNNISHEWLISNVPMDKNVLKQFLKSGYVFEHELFPTDNGAPQGGNISPIFANLALDGIQNVLAKRFHTNSKGNIAQRTSSKNKVNLCRYADDFIVTAATKEIAQEAKEIIKNFLKTRGLELSESKTVISHIDDGFDLLGWNFRKFDGKLIVKPSKKSIKNLIDSLSETILREGKAWEQGVLIQKLNAQIRGWTNYHQTSVASKVFSHIDYVLFNLLYRWAKFRHPKKGAKWVARRYWHQQGNRSWVFSTDKIELINASHTPIIRHTSIRMNANPYLDMEYFTKRKFDNGAKRLSGRFKQVWKNQKGCCHHCGMPLENSEDREIFFKTPKSEGGTELVKNMAYVHKYCNSLYFESRSKEL